MKHNLSKVEREMPYECILSALEAIGTGVEEKKTCRLRIHANYILQLVDYIEKKGKQEKPAIPSETPSVMELRRQGAKVRVTEKRYVHLSNQNDPLYNTCLGPYPLNNVRDPNFRRSLEMEIHNHGGHQIVEISKDGKEYRGEAHCSLEDVFDRKYGRSLAIARALGLLPAV